jgi:hypothetical protein
LTDVVDGWNDGQGVPAKRQLQRLQQLHHPAQSYGAGSEKLPL